MSQATLLESTVPYPVPFPAEKNEGVARTTHREWYWNVNDYDTYECPDCGRGTAEVREFEVHHKDRNPLNGAPSNLIGLCVRCHGWRHGGKSISGLSLTEWKEALVNQEYDL